MLFRSVHSGVSACSLPPYSLSDAVIAEIERQTEALAHALSVRGLMNIQFAVKDGRVYLIEIDVQGALQLRGLDVEGLFVFIAPPSMEVLRARLEGRGTDSQEVI